jgi:hypothetical protein
VSLKRDVAAEMNQAADDLERRAEGWPSRPAFELARQAAGEAAAILRDAATELLAPPRERARV